jgi:hypothetical protein
MTAIEWFGLRILEQGGDYVISVFEQAKEMEKNEKHAEYMRGWKDGYVKNENYKNTKE